MRDNEPTGASSELVIIDGIDSDGENTYSYVAYAGYRQVGPAQQPFQMTSRENALENLWRALTRALDALKNPECSSLYGNEKTRSKGFDPSTVLESIVTGFRTGSGSRYANVAIDPTGAGAEVTKGKLGLGKITMTLGQVGLQGGVHGVDDIAHTLLHELGHVYDLTLRSGGSQIASPDDLPPFLGGSKRSHENDVLVDQKCFNGALGYGK